MLKRHVKRDKNFQKHGLKSCSVLVGASETSHSVDRIARRPAQHNGTILQHQIKHKAGLPSSDHISFPSPTSNQGDLLMPNGSCDKLPMSSLCNLSSIFQHRFWPSTALSSGANITNHLPHHLHMHYYCLYTHLMLIQVFLRVIFLGWCSKLSFVPLPHTFTTSFPLLLHHFPFSSTAWHTSGTRSMSCPTVQLETEISTWIETPNLDGRWRKFTPLFHVARRLLNYA